MNGDGVYDETDQYECEDTRYHDDPPMMRIVTMEEWLEEIAGYLYVDEDGTVKAVESLEWKAYSVGVLDVGDYVIRNWSGWAGVGMAGRENINIL